MKESSYSLYRELPGVGFDEAVERTTRALKDQGFGVLTTIDVKATLKEKIDADFREYTILGACNPELARRALETEDNIGLMLPCNVVVAVTGNGSEVSIVNPHAMLSVAEAKGMESLASEAKTRLDAALAAV